MITEETIEKVWKKGIIVEGFNSSEVRKDYAGAFILKSHYNNRYSDYGWEIDHVFPISKGGDDNILNLRPMQWENNLKKSDNYPVYEAVVVAQGNGNIRKESVFTVNEELQEILRRLYNI